MEFYVNSWVNATISIVQIKHPKKFVPKIKALMKWQKKIVNITSDNSNNGLNLDQLSFEDLFKTNMIAELIVFENL
jgi:hypothetical protein